MRREPRDPEAPRSARHERASADSGSSREKRGRDEGGVCCDEQMVGAERFPRKGDGEDEYDE